MSCNDAYEICGYIPKNREVSRIEISREKKEFAKNFISFPNDMLPEDEDAMKNDLLNQILRVAKENGIKKKHIK